MKHRTSEEISEDVVRQLDGIRSALHHIGDALVHLLALMERVEKKDNGHA